MRNYLTLFLLASLLTVGHGKGHSSTSHTSSTSSHKSSTTTPTSISTCSPRSIAVCPTPFDPCCAYICDEAQVPFAVCQPTNETVLASCSKCPSPTAHTTTSTHTITGAPTMTTSTCTGRLLSTAGCPTPYDPCCAYVCEEAQVPYDVCSLTDGTGEYATCSKCPSPTP